MAVTTKAGVEFTTIAPAGMRLLEAIRAAGHALHLSLVITSACDGTHAGPTDPHYSGEAYDLRSHDLNEAQKDALLKEILLTLQVDQSDAPLSVAGGLATRRFFGFVESRGTSAEHIHVQRRNGTVYTMKDYLDA